MSAKGTMSSKNKYLSSYSETNCKKLTIFLSQNNESQKHRRQNLAWSKNSITAERDLWIERKRIQDDLLAKEIDRKEYLEIQRKYPNVKKEKQRQNCIEREIREKSLQSVFQR